MSIHPGWVWLAYCMEALIGMIAPERTKSGALPRGALTLTVWPPLYLSPEGWLLGAPEGQ